MENILVNYWWAFGLATLGFALIIGLVQVRFMYRIMNASEFPSFPASWLLIVLFGVLSTGSFFAFIIGLILLIIKNLHK